MSTNGQGDPREILRVSQDADMISNYVLALEKERVTSNIEKLSKISRAQLQPVPTRWAARTRAAASHE